MFGEHRRDGRAQVVWEEHRGIISKVGGVQVGCTIASLLTVLILKLLLFLGYKCGDISKIGEDPCSFLWRQDVIITLL